MVWRQSTKYPQCCVRQGTRFTWFVRNIPSIANTNKSMPWLSPSVTPQHDARCADLAKDLSLLATLPPSPEWYGGPYVLPRYRTGRLGLRRRRLDFSSGRG